MIETLYAGSSKMMMKDETRIENDMGMMFVSLLLTVLLVILILYIGKLLWNCCLATNVAGVKPLKSWVDLLGIYILIRILICK
jgi:hypothetical protein